MNYSGSAFEKELAAFAEEQRRLIEAEVSGFSTNVVDGKKRHDKATNDFEYFCRTYFPHYVKSEKSVFHHYVYEEAPRLIDADKGCKEAVDAPRGEAKSTLFTQLLNLWVINTERKYYPVIIMDSFDQSSMMLEAIKAELEHNPRLRQDFPEACGAGRVWRADVIVTANNIKVQVAGVAKKIRGWRHGPYRPDMLTLDDIENDENVRSKTQRDKIESWLNKAALKLGPPDGSMDVFYVGTILHYDSVLNRTKKKPTWRSHHFQAIIEWPDRMDLWDKWEEILINDSEEAADLFYKKRRKKMDAGAVVSWPGVRPIELLMKIRADDHHSFSSEYQNDPSNDENAPFKEIQFWVHKQRFWIYYGACDPSLGRQNKARDPSAILIGGLDKETGIMDVVEARIRRRVPDLIISDIISMQEEYNCLLWGIETVAFQEFLYTELVKRGREMGVPIPARGIKQHTDKAMRIESMQPHIAHGTIRLHRSQTTLFEQLRHYPEADHDDGPDALEMLWGIANSGMGGLPTVTGSTRRQKTAYAGYD